MVDDEEVSDVLSLGHGQPVATAGVSVDVVLQVVEFVLDDPVLRCVTAPQLSVSLLLLVHPDLRVAFEAPGRQ